MKKKLLFLSCGRSDFGLIYNVYSKFKFSKKFKSTMFCCGSIISANYGYKKSEIIQFDKEIKFFNYANDKSSEKNLIRNLYNINYKLIIYLKKNLPDLVFILGDRIETIHLAVSIKSLNIPLAHLHGGESTKGVYDDYWRHSVSKLSNIHFVSNNKYKNNLIKMGEKKNRIYSVGAYGIENIKNINMKLYEKNFFQKKYSFKFNKYNFVIVFHSITFDPKNNKDYIKNIISSALKVKDANLFISHPGYDIGSEELIGYLKTKAVSKNKRIFIFSNLGNEKFLSLVNLCDLVLGNSSSAIIEIPYLNKPVIDIGDRQGGRVKPNLVFNSKYKSISIYNKIIKIIKLKKNNQLPINNKIYGNGNSAKKTFEIINKINIEHIKTKSFF